MPPACCTMSWVGALSEEKGTETSDNNPVLLKPDDTFPILGFSIAL
ncbi:MAG: hypothetical protein KKF96_01410 [Proteobacteria bacterium]|nr:hypothetical protein [Pseudomonadota bacterium]